MNELNLSPCPFCGSKLLTVHAGCTEDGDKYQIGCINCGTSGPLSEGVKDAIGGWNARNEDTCSLVESRQTYDGPCMFRFSCRHITVWHDIEPPNYCPDCGAKVVDG